MARKLAGICPSGLGEMDIQLGLIPVIIALLICVATVAALLFEAPAIAAICAGFWPDPAQELITSIYTMLPISGWAILSPMGETQKPKFTKKRDNGISGKHPAFSSAMHSSVKPAEPRTQHIKGMSPKAPLSKDCKIKTMKPFSDSPSEYDVVSTNEAFERPGFESRLLTTKCRPLSETAKAPYGKR
jgi:hypothetical protein